MIYFNNDKTIESLQLYKGNFSRQEILEALCRGLKVTKEQLTSRSKPQWLTEARQIYFFFCVTICTDHLIEYALEIGCPFHTSVLYGHKNISEKLDINDEQITEKVLLTLKELIGNNLYK